MAGGRGCASGAARAPGNRDLGRRRIESAQCDLHAECVDLGGLALRGGRGGLGA